MSKEQECMDALMKLRETLDKVEAQLEGRPTNNPMDLFNQMFQSAAEFENTFK